MKIFTNSYIRYIFTLDQINNAAIKDSEAFVSEIEDDYHKQIKYIAKNVLKAKNTHKVVMLAGPSGSGKTTTAHLLHDMLKEFGYNSVIISLDNFYKGRENTPLNKYGEPDFETVDALNVDDIKNSISSLLKEGYCEIPVFNFSKSRPEPYKNFLKLENNSVAIIEGIHALNPIFLEDFYKDDISKIYISVKQGIIDSKSNSILHNNSIRLIRRIVRDYLKRSTSAEGTLSMWDSVREGQIKYIAPFKRSSSLTVNSLHIYELCVLRNFAIPLLKEIPNSSKYYDLSQKLISSLEKFSPIGEDKVPKKSLIREFIGGGVY